MHLPTVLEMTQLQKIALHLALKFHKNVLHSLKALVKSYGMY